MNRIMKSLKNINGRLFLSLLLHRLRAVLLFYCYQ